VVIENLDVATNLTALLADIGANEWIVILAEFKLYLNAYLADLWTSPVRSLADIIAFNNAHPVEVSTHKKLNNAIFHLFTSYYRLKNSEIRVVREKQKLQNHEGNFMLLQERLEDFGQGNLIAAEKTQGIGSVERAAIQRLEELSANGLEKLMKDKQLDAIVTPDTSASSLLAIAGHPAIVVPAGYAEAGTPFGICFGGLHGYEPRLIEMAYAFEQATKVRKQPKCEPDSEAAKTRFVP
jgi:amidase